MTIENQPGTPSDPIERDAKIVTDAGIDLGQQRERELKDKQELPGVVAQEQALEEQLAATRAHEATLKADAADAEAREAADKKAIAEAADRLNRGAVPGPGPAPQPPRPRVG